MNFIKNNILFIAVVLLVLWLYFLLKPKQQDNGIHDLHGFIKIKSLVDTIYKDTVIYRASKPIPYKVIDSVPYAVHDTVQIISDYMRTYAYSDTIKMDSNTFVIDDTVSRNKILGRGFTAHLKTKTVYKQEYYTDKPKYTLFWGLRGDFSYSNGLEVLSPGLMLNAKNKAIIGLSLDISKNYNIGYSGSIYFKLSKK